MTPALSLVVILLVMVVVGLGVWMFLAVKGD